MKISQKWCLKVKEVLIHTGPNLNPEKVISKSIKTKPTLEKQALLVFFKDILGSQLKKRY